MFIFSLFFVISEIRANRNHPLNFGVNLTTLRKFGSTNNSKIFHSILSVNYERTLCSLKVQIRFQKTAPMVHEIDPNF